MLFLPGGSVHDGRVRLHAAGCLKNLFDMRIRTFILAVAVFLTFGAGMACAQEARRMPSDSVMTGGRDGFVPVEHHFSLFTNVADWSHFGTMNASFLYSVSRRSTVGATLRYNPFCFGRGGGARMYKMRAAEVDYRFWPWHVYSGWWMLADAQAREYNRANIWGMDYDEQDGPWEPDSASATPTCFPTAGTSRGEFPSGAAIRIIRGTSAPTAAGSSGRVRSRFSSRTGCSSTSFTSFKGIGHV